MQQAPYRLTQALRSAFRASKPINRSRFLQPHTYSPVSTWRRQEPLIAKQARFYSDKQKDIDRKVEDAKTRIEDALEARAEAASEPDMTLKPPQEETIIHTNPEASSIVHPRENEAIPLPPPSSTAEHRPESLPSRQPSNTSPLRLRFASFMDNFQTHIFTASQRLNDLTGYSGIETLKNEISNQETLVINSRKAVRDARSHYAATVATRSTTQREVNDLLHRKHAWSSTDLERFTSLYRSDHANEQAETAAQKSVSDAETRYEEASTTLARTILARYHEEQIWSDKIRQMSTWGTWGLMGLNVLLFVVFQIMIEPWRRRRLVKGFEEKVEVALRERDESLQNTLKYGIGNIRPNAEGAVTSESVMNVSSAEAGTKVDGMADHIAGQIVDAISGTSSGSEAASTKRIEGAAETVASQEFAAGAEASQAPPSPGESLSAAAESVFATTATGYAYYQEAFRELFSEKTLVVTQKEMTTVALEGAVGGAAFMGLLLVLLRPR